MTASTRPTFAPIAALAALLCPLVIAACGHDTLTGPPTLRLGRDECNECGMIINEERFAAALLVEDAATPTQAVPPTTTAATTSTPSTAPSGADRRHLIFDDIGDMLDHQRFHPGLRVVSRFVHDSPSKAWIDADRAFYLLSEKVHTPMGSGIAAFTDRAAAEAQLSASPGRVFTYAEMADARAAWMQEKYGK